MKRYLISGSNGMLGHAIREVFKDCDLIFTDSTNMDVRNITQVMSYAEKKPDIILHLAAETDLIKADFNPADAYLTNETGTQNMVLLARTLDIPIIYVSTAGVFDGEKEIYTEEDTPNPIHHYGRSKWYGELVVKEYLKHYILRIGWAMGGGPEIDKKFINKIFKQIKAGKKKLHAITDIYGSPTYTLDFAKTIKNITTSDLPYGLYHSAGNNSASRYDVLKHFVNLLGLSNEIELVPLTCKEFYTLFPLQYTNTKSEVLSIDKLEKTGLSAMRNWQEALSEYAKEYKI